MFQLYQLTDRQVQILNMLFDANLSNKPLTLVIAETDNISLDYNVLSAYGFLTKHQYSLKIEGSNAWKYRLSLSGCLVAQGITGAKVPESATFLN